MTGAGTLVNVLAVLAGTMIGTLVGHRFPEGVHVRVLRGLGLVTLVIGVDLALEWRDTNTLFVLGGILLGGVAGELLRIEDRLQAFGDKLQQRFEGDLSDGESTVAEGFFTASILFCVRAMAVVGSLQDGLSGNPETLYTKATLDGFAAIALAASLGWGVGLSVISILIYQGTLTLAAGQLDSVLAPGSDALLSMTSAGGVLIIGIALKLLDIKDVKVGNFLPALVIAPCIAGLTGWLT